MIKLKFGQNLSAYFAILKKAIQTLGLQNQVQIIMKTYELDPNTSKADEIPVKKTLIKKKDFPRCKSKVYLIRLSCVQKNWF